MRERKTSSLEFGAPAVNVCFTIVSFPCFGRRQADNQVTSSLRNVISVVTKDATGHYYLLACNSGIPGVTVTANLSALITSGTRTQWEFSAANNDVVVGTPTLSNGQVTFSIPANGTELLKF